MNLNTHALFLALQQGQHMVNYSIQDGLMRQKGKIIVRPDGLKMDIM